ncbi:MAG: hypothetical protein ACLRXC_07945 [[Clostridium] leptum]
MLDQAAVSGKSDVIFVIGGSFGLSQAVKERADRRDVHVPDDFPPAGAGGAAEQVYRGYQILSGGNIINKTEVKSLRLIYDIYWLMQWKIECEQAKKCCGFCLPDGNKIK